MHENRQTKNDVSSNSNGILLIGAKNNSILYNTVRRNLGCDTRPEKADGNTVRNNSLDGNLLGVFDDGLNFRDKNHYGGRPAVGSLIKDMAYVRGFIAFPAAEVLMSTPDVLWL